ncbi:acyl-CoA dehydrogenase family protein [Parvibaculum sp.]|jgi:alkylation response protein AidB-like acyl-CoA dehydrogenase|uniref:acyl-CoA dehydrogenase family protein n=1 Tax=Parvibaculum sp. TaxID=2024848 RepID=UPI000C42049C|nr:acyl-CoA dehydrogenase family protein [Parvibaculum sp.]MAM95230.1 pimeloyl-CoA dehydrogenase large subunit [Parvibaculum sp.]HCX66934.1 pimeloyl-CoA dehydrogenase large subunit [Rhodobiaceae bacterium]|tara:strand:+ start:10164 stop:11351 length:1188 start_codon:yes stop_codon:yes gene_type:complete
MDMRFSPEEMTFRDEVREFIANNYPEELRGARRGEMSKEDILKWHRILYKKGWVVPHWPVEYGGTGWTITQRYIWNEENARAETTPLLPFGLSMVGPVIYTFGNEEQKKRFLPGILSGDDWWCQGYSEPGSGSDLASLRTRAVREGDHYIVNGSKTWTTLAQHADWMFCLVRTDPNAKQQEGISFLLIDMKTPGITVRPIITMDGSHEVNEVFLEDVKVPAENLIGEENKGWTYAKFLLGNERSGIAGVARSKKAIERLKKLATAELLDGEPLMKTDEFSRKVAELEIDLSALEVTELRTLAAESKGRGPGPEASILKIKGTEIQQRITELAVEAVGNYALVEAPRLEVTGNEFVPGPEGSQGVAQDYFNMRKTSIYGGSNEIQHNIIAKMVLGL